ncbi:MAG: vWA domain-containing protein [Snowella sp.]|nr:vWA domain-containing protein [Snowella sp.]
MSQDYFKSPLARFKSQENQSITQKRERRTYEQLLEQYAKPTRVIGLVDATGSMQPVWSKTLENIQELIHRLLEAGQVELSWVAYRDYCDNHRIIEQSDWSNSAEYLKTFMGKIACNGGGDFPEAVEKALEIAIKESVVSRVILIGDAPPHEDKNYREYAIAFL